MNILITGAGKGIGLELAKTIAEQITNFSLNAHKFMNGKIIPVSITTP